MDAIVKEELKKLGSTAVPSLGCMAIAVAVGITFIIAMQAVCFHPIKEDCVESHDAWFSRRNFTVWHVLNSTCVCTAKQMQ